MCDAEGGAFRACPSAEITLVKVQFRDVQTRTCNTSQVGYLDIFLREVVAFLVAFLVAVLVALHYNMLCSTL